MDDGIPLTAYGDNFEWDSFGIVRTHRTKISVNASDRGWSNATSQMACDRQLQSRVNDCEDKQPFIELPQKIEEACNFDEAYIESFLIRCDSFVLQHVCIWGRKLIHSLKNPFEASEEVVQQMMVLI
jgi:hypothetical protein